MKVTADRNLATTPCFHNTMTLEHALPGKRETFDSDAGVISYYTDAPDNPANTTPLLLIHTINAAAGAHEIRPLYEHYRQTRPVYAIDLPGYGFSERSDREYTPRLMTDAVHAICNRILSNHECKALDALAVSTSCEFLARAAHESPDAYQSLAFVAPTGFNKQYPYKDEPLSNRGMPAFLRVLRFSIIGETLFSLLTSRRSVRFFLQKTWGSKQIDEVMYEYSYLSTKQPGACYAPFYFLSGFMFSQDINTIYESLPHPIWMSHGVRGDFTNYCWKETLQVKSNWQFSVFETGALSYFEMLDEFCKRYDQFLMQSA